MKLRWSESGWFTEVKCGFRGGCDPNRDEGRSEDGEFVLSSGEPGREGYGSRLGPREKEVGRWGTRTRWSVVGTRR